MYLLPLVLLTRMKLRYDEHTGIRSRSRRQMLQCKGVATQDCARLLSTMMSSTFVTVFLFYWSLPQLLQVIRYGDSVALCLFPVEEKCLCTCPKLIRRVGHYYRISPSAAHMLNNNTLLSQTHLRYVFLIVTQKSSLKHPLIVLRVARSLAAYCTVAQPNITSLCHLVWALEV